MKNDPYSIYKKYKNVLRQYIKKIQRDTLSFALTDIKSDRMKFMERQEWERLEKFKKAWNSIILNNCCHCDKPAILAQNINCGIDGGPGPVTVYGLKIYCNCGMQTDIYHYRGHGEKLEAYTECSINWNNKK